METWRATDGEIAVQSSSNRPVMGPQKKPRRLTELGPHSRVLSRGAIGGLINGRSREGRYLRAFEQQLIEHCGGQPTALQHVLINRTSRVALRLELYDEKLLTGGVLTDHDARVYAALHNALRLLLRELRVKAAAKGPSLAEHLARRAAERAVA